MRRNNAFFFLPMICKREALDVQLAKPPSCKSEAKRPLFPVVSFVYVCHYSIWPPGSFCGAFLPHLPPFELDIWRFALIYHCLLPTHFLQIKTIALESLLNFLSKDINIVKNSEVTVKM